MCHQIQAAVDYGPVNPLTCSTLRGVVDARGSRLKRLIDDVVLAQGNDFIKELLRSKGLRIGATKTQFRLYLHAAVDDGLLTEADVEAWLHAVEGWGAQHVYLYTVPATFATNRRWSDPAALPRRSGYPTCGTRRRPTRTRTT